METIALQLLQEVAPHVWPSLRGTPESGEPPLLAGRSPEAEAFSGSTAQELRRLLGSYLNMSPSSKTSGLTST